MPNRHHAWKSDPCWSSMSAWTREKTGYAGHTPCFPLGQSADVSEPATWLGQPTSAYDLSVNLLSIGCRTPNKSNVHIPKCWFPFTFVHVAASPSAIAPINLVKPRSS